MLLTAALGGGSPEVPRVLIGSRAAAGGGGSAWVTRGRGGVRRGGGLSFASGSTSCSISGFVTVAVAARCGKFSWQRSVIQSALRGSGREPHPTPGTTLYSKAHMAHRSCTCWMAV